MQNQIFNEDCIAGMAARIPDASVDLVITDPPFGIEFQAKKANYNRKGGRVLEGYNEVKGADYLAFTQGWLGEVRRGAQAFEAELRGLQAALNVPVGRVFSRFCDADLGDARDGGQVRQRHAEGGEAHETVELRVHCDHAPS